MDEFRQCAIMSHSVDAKMVAFRRNRLELGQWRSLRKASCPSARYVAAQTTGSVEQTTIALVVRVLGEQDIGLRIAAEAADSVCQIDESILKEKSVIVIMNNYTKYYALEQVLDCVL